MRYGEASQLADDCGDRYLRIAVLNNLSYTQYEAGLADEAVATAEQLLAEAERQGVPLQTHDGDTVARAYIAVRPLQGRRGHHRAVLRGRGQRRGLRRPGDGTAHPHRGTAQTGDVEAGQAALDRADRLARSTP